MKYIGMAVTQRAAANSMQMFKGDAKLRKTMVLVTIVASKNPSDDNPDPLDWNELDSLMSKPPQRERKPKKAAYTKPDLVKRLEQVTGNKHRDDTANGLTRCIIAYLKYKGWQAERINTTGIPHDTRQQARDILGRTRTIGSVEWRPSGSTVGSADISATIGGRSVKIEVKIGKDRQSEAQRQYQAAIEQAGGIYYIARNFTDFWKWYQRTFVQKGVQR